MFKFLLEHENSSALNVYILFPPFVNITVEFRVKELGILKLERFVSWCTHNSGFKVYKPMI